MLKTSETISRGLFEEILSQGLKLGWVNWVIWVNRVMFCPSQPGLTHFVKYPGLTWIMHWITCVIMASGGNHISDNASVSLQQVSEKVIAGDYILKKKNVKASRAWEQFRIVVNSSNNEEVFGVASCCV